MNRRSFLTACLATFAAPSIVRASSLMPMSSKLSIADQHWTTVTGQMPGEFSETVVQDSYFQNHLHGGHWHPDRDLVITYDAQYGLWRYHNIEM